MSIVLLSLLLAFIAGGLTVLVGVATYNEIQDVRSVRRLNAISDGWSDDHEIVDGVCVSCGYVYEPVDLGFVTDAIEREVAYRDTVARARVADWDNVRDDASSFDEGEMEVVRDCGF